MNPIKRQTGYLALVLIFASGCGVSKDPPASQIPSRMIWAWERPEDLEFLGGNAGVAYLAQTLVLENDEVVAKRRRQPLKINPDTYLIAVTRIETPRATNMRPHLSAAQMAKIRSLILETLDGKSVKGVQIDFDAARSEREFYADLLVSLRASISEEIPLSITALASWCMGDRWLTDLPVDEVVPMLFDMGTGAKEIIRGLEDGKDWSDPRCRSSYGLAIYEKIEIELKTGRRMYYFNNRAWKPADTIDLF